MAYFSIGKQFHFLKKHAIICQRGVNMDLEKNKKTILEIIVITIVLIFALIHISSILDFLGYLIGLFMPFIIGAMIAFVLNVLLNIVENKFFSKLNQKKYKYWQKWHRPVSLTITLLLIVGTLVFLLYLVIPQLQNTAEIFTKNLPNYRKESVELLENFGVSKKDINNFNNYIIDFKDGIISFVSSNKEKIMDTTIGVAANIFQTITTWILAIVFAIYILLKKETLARQAKEIIYAYGTKKQEEKLQQIATLSNKTFANFITGQCMEAFIIGILCFLGMLILKIPYAATISVLVGFTALIPVFGAFIGTIIGAFLIFMFNPSKAIIFIIYIIILQQIEGNLIYPKVVGKSVGLPSIWVMVAVTIGASIYGMIGMLLSVPLCSILYSIFRTSVKGRIKEKEKKLKKEKKG